VHDVRIPLDLHQRVHRDAPCVCHAAHVIAAEVHEHDVLRQLLLVCGRVGRAGDERADVTVECV